MRENMGFYGGGGVLVRTRVLVTFALVWGTLITAQVRTKLLSFGNFGTISTLTAPLLRDNLSCDNCLIFRQFKL